MRAEHRSDRGLLDTNILIHLPRLEADSLPREAAISAITVAELAAGVHAAVDALERAARLDVLQRAEHTFEPIPFDADAARAYGVIIAAVRETGRSPRARVADHLIAAIALARELPLYTTNADDFLGLDRVLTVYPVERPGHLNSRLQSTSGMGILTVELGVPYAGWPVRCGADYEFGSNILSEDLRQRIEVWAREFNEQFDESTGWRSEARRREHFATGVVLKHDIERDLGSGYRVILNRLGSGS